MSRRSSRITRSTRKRPRATEEYTPDVSEVTGQEDISEGQQKRLRTENESKEESSSPDGLVAVAAAAPGDDGTDVVASAAPDDDGTDVDAAAAPGDGMDVDTDVTSLTKSAIDRFKEIHAKNKANIDKILSKFPDIINEGVDGDVFGIDTFVKMLDAPDINNIKVLNQLISNINTELGKINDEISGENLGLFLPKFEDLMLLNEFPDDKNIIRRILYEKTMTEIDDVSLLSGKVCPFSLQPLDNEELWETEGIPVKVSNSEDDTIYYHKNHLMDYYLKGDTFTGTIGKGKIVSNETLLDLYDSRKGYQINVENTKKYRDVEIKIPNVYAIVGVEKYLQIIDLMSKYYVNYKKIINYYNDEILIKNITMDTDIVSTEIRTKLLDRFAYLWDSMEFFSKNILIYLHEKQDDSLIDEFKTIINNLFGNSTTKTLKKDSENVDKTSFKLKKINDYEYKLPNHINILTKSLSNITGLQPEIENFMNFNVNIPLLIDGEEIMFKGIVTKEILDDEIKRKSGLGLILKIVKSMIKFLPTMGDATGDIGVDKYIRELNSRYTTVNSNMYGLMRYDLIKGTNKPPRFITKELGDEFIDLLNNKYIPELHPNYNIIKGEMKKFEDPEYIELIKSKGLNPDDLETEFMKSSKIPLNKQHYIIINTISNDGNDYKDKIQNILKIEPEEDEESKLFEDIDASPRLFCSVANYFDYYVKTFQTMSFKGIFIPGSDKFFEYMEKEEAGSDIFTDIESKLFDLGVVDAAPAPADMEVGDAAPADMDVVEESMNDDDDEDSEMTGEGFSTINQIVDPTTGIKYYITSRQGRELLKKYLSSYINSQ